jgi:hypothetical protein
MPGLPEIDLGYRPGTQLTPSKRNKIVGMRLGGYTPQEIASATKIPLQTIRNTISLDPIRYKGYSLPGRGLKPTYDHVFERNLLRFVRTNLKATYQKVRDALHTTLSNRTLCGILAKNHITNWRAKKRPLLLIEHARLRRQWCFERRQYEEAMWGTFIFLDECSLERGSGRRRT